MMQSHGGADALTLTRRSFELADERDYDALMELFAADSVWDVSPWGLGSHTGLRAIRHFFQDWMGGFDEYAVEVEEMTDVGNGVVFVIAEQFARSAGSRGSMRLRYAPVFICAGGVIERVTHYRDVGEGRTAAAEAAARALDAKSA
jgi:ketosteroid isomerase-like protein